MLKSWVKQLCGRFHELVDLCKITISKKNNGFFPFSSVVLFLLSLWDARWVSYKKQEVRTFTITRGVAVIKLSSMILSIWLQSVLSLILLFRYAVAWEISANQLRVINMRVTICHKYDNYSFELFGQSHCSYHTNQIIVTLS